ncbi:MAG: M23 family metallopeptidase [Spirochaetes bacterium]|nr:M23 family metallopeptidase [Spirochaetota bacterium]
MKKIVIPISGIFLILLSCARDITKVTISNTPVPRNFPKTTIQVITHTTDDISCMLFAQRFTQGNIVYFEIVPANKVNAVSVVFQDKRIPATQRSFGWRGFFAIPPDLQPGTYTFSVTVGTKNIVIPVAIAQTQFRISTIPMDLGKFSQKEYLESPQVQEFIRVSTQKKQQAFATQFGDLIRGKAYHPRDIHEVNSTFWAKRVYKLYDSTTGKTHTVERIHRGIDLNGDRGDPVYAMLDGIVVLAEMLFYEGNMVIINHGNGIFSYYMHMEKLYVTSGDKVAAGQLIGTVGSSGMSTGPHLHVSLIVDGVQVDPMSLLSLPIRE